MSIAKAEATRAAELSRGWLDSLSQRHRKALVGALLASVLAGAGVWGYLHARQQGPLAPAAATKAAKSAMPSDGKDPDSGGTVAEKSDKIETSQGSPWPLWEFQLRDPIIPREEALTPLPWRLIGASAVSGTWQLIVLRQGKTEPEYFRVGDKLPGNYRIEAISEEDVTLKHGRRELVLSFIAS